MTFTTLENVLWAAGFAGNLALLGVLLLKRRARSFPIFTCFIASQLIQDVTLFQVSRGSNAHTYFLVYWAFAAIGYIAQLAIIFEIARDVLRPTGSWVTDARKSFFFWSLLGAVAAAALAFIISPSGKSEMQLWSTRSSLFTSLLTCEVYLAMVTAAKKLGLQWRNHVMTLGEGLAFWAMIALLVDGARYGTIWHGSLRELGIVRNAAYVATTIFWTITFAMAEQRREPLSDEMMQYLSELHQEVQQDLEIVLQEAKRRS